MRLRKVAVSATTTAILIISGQLWAQQAADSAPIMAELHEPKPYEVSQGTFLNLLLEHTDPNYVSAVIYQNIYDHFENIAIPQGSRLFGRQVSKKNNVRDVYFTEIQLSSTGQTYTLEPPLQATGPLGQAGLVDFKSAAIAGAIWRRDLVIPH